MRFKKEKLATAEREFFYELAAIEARGSGGQNVITTVHGVSMIFNCHLIRVHQCPSVVENHLARRESRVVRICFRSAWGDPIW
jgi:protein subunit release factor B